MGERGRGLGLGMEGREMGEERERLGGYGKREGREREGRWERERGWRGEMEKGWRRDG